VNDEDGVIEFDAVEIYKRFTKKCKKPVVPPQWLIDTDDSEVPAFLKELPANTSAIDFLAFNIEEDIEILIDYCRRISEQKVSTRHIAAESAENLVQSAKYF
jgi:hypothetical protein